jgi:hypothetical protein
MKLYATIESNRAKKGQGGDYLHIDINVGMEKVAEINVMQYGDDYIIKYQNIINGVGVGIAKELKRLKGKRQKGEKCISCGIIPDNLGRCKCCNKDAF